MVQTMAEYIEREEAKVWIANALSLIPSTDVKPVTWIPVTERLPENMTSVIVHRKDGGIFIWEYFYTSQTDDCWIDDSMNVYSFYDVTHWMPLPKPPKDCEP